MGENEVSVDIEIHPLPIKKQQTIKNNPQQQNPENQKKPTALKVKIILLLVLPLGCQSVKSNSESQLTVTVIKEKLLQA